MTSCIQVHLATLHSLLFQVFIIHSLKCTCELKIWVIFKFKNLTENILWTLLTHPNLILLNFLNCTYQVFKCSVIFQIKRNWIQCLKIFVENILIQQNFEYLDQRAWVLAHAVAWHCCLKKIFYIFCSNKLNVSRSPIQ